MKFFLKNKTIIIESPALVSLAGFISAGRRGLKNAKAAAFFPFVLVHNEKYATAIFINHEKIHFRQQWETLFIGLLVITICEDLYTKFFLKLESHERYLYRCSEQEAYRNQSDFQYLSNRKTFSLFRYLKDKKQFYIVQGKEPEIKYKE